MTHEDARHGDLKSEAAGQCRASVLSYCAYSLLGTYWPTPYRRRLDPSAKPVAPWCRYAR